MKPRLPLRIVVEAPPPGVVLAVQRGRSEWLVPVASDDAAWIFEFAVDVADAEAEPPRLTGEFAQGPPATRFVYVNSGTLAGQAGSPWTRRAKVALGGIDRAKLQAALAQPDQVLTARIPGHMRDSGPICASVKPIAGWTLETRRG